MTGDRRRSPQWWVGALTAVAAILLVLMATLSQPTPFGLSNDIGLAPTPTADAADANDAGGPNQAGGSDEDGTPTVGAIFAVSLGALAIGLVLGVVMLFFVGSTERIGRSRRVSGHIGVADEPDDATTQEVIDVAVGRSLRRIATGTPTDAIIACWVVLENAAERAGVERVPTETTAQFTARVVAVRRGTPLSETSLLRLADLYREARFSRHPMTEVHRAEARAELEVLSAELSSRRSHGRLPAGGAQ